MLKAVCDEGAPPHTHFIGNGKAPHATTILDQVLLIDGLESLCLSGKVRNRRPTMKEYLVTAHLPPRCLRTKKCGRMGNQNMGKTGWFNFLGSTFSGALLWDPFRHFDIAETPEATRCVANCSIQKPTS